MGLVVHAVWGVPNASKRAEKTVVAHKSVDWLYHACHMGDPQHFKAGDKKRSAPQVGLVATSPLLYGGSPTLQSGGQKHQWPTSGSSGTCRLPPSPHFRAGDKNTRGPQLDRFATSPLPSGGPNTLEQGTTSALVSLVVLLGVNHCCF